MSNDDYNQEKARISSALLQFIDQLPDNPTIQFGDPRVVPFHPVNNKPESNFWKRLGYTGLIVGIISGLVAVFQPFCGSVRQGGSAQLTVYVQDVQSKPIPELQNKGQVIIRFGHDLRDPIIGENGRTNIGGIPTEFLGKEVEVMLVAEGWELTSPGKKYNMDGEQIYLTVKRDNSLGTIQGIVQTRDGNAFIAGALVMVDHDTTVLTDSLGRFRLLLPEKMHRTEYLLTVKKAGFKDANEMYRPKTTPADIRLEQ